MNKLYISLIAVAFLLITGYFVQTSYKASEMSDVQIACENSGGVFVDDNCTCPSKIESDDSATYTYDEKNGECTDAFGLPGGISGEEIKKSHPLNNK